MFDRPAEVVGELRINELSPPDLAPLLAFYRSLAPNIVRTFRPYGWQVTAQVLADGPLGRIAGGQEFALVLVDDGGNIWAHAFLQDLHAERGPTLGLGVHQSLLGRRLGRKLITALLHAADHTLMCRRISLTAVQDNTPAVDLYKSMGFEITGEFVSEDDGMAYYNMRRTFPDGGE